MPSRQFQLWVAAIGAAFIAAVYIPDLGAGFVKDDSLWILTAAGALRRPASFFMVDSSGFFFRPLVTASFAFDYLLHGVSAGGYGFTNLALCLGCVAAIVILFRELGVSAAAAAIGALAWAVNPHGIGMALLWISGRTSLLMTLCSTFSILAFLRGQRALGAVLPFLGDVRQGRCRVAVLRPGIRRAYAAGRTARRDLRPWRAPRWMAAAEAVHFVLRMRTSAMTPATAPRISPAPVESVGHCDQRRELSDRAASGAALIACVAGIVYRTRAVLTGSARRGLAPAAIWFAAGLCDHGPLAFRCVSGCRHTRCSRRSAPRWRARSCSTRSGRVRQKPRRAIGFGLCVGRVLALTPGTDSRCAIRRAGARVGTHAADTGRRSWNAARSAAPLCFRTRPHGSARSATRSTAWPLRPVALHGPH